MKGDYRMHYGKEKNKHFLVVREFGWAGWERERMTMSVITYVGSSFWVVQGVQSEYTVHCSAGWHLLLWTDKQMLLGDLKNTEWLTSSGVFPRAQMSVLQWLAADHRIAEKGREERACFIAVAKDATQRTFHSLRGRHSFARIRYHRNWHK